MRNVLSYSQREAIVRGYASKAGFAATDRPRCRETRERFSLPHRHAANGSAQAPPDDRPAKQSRVEQEDWIASSQCSSQ